MSDHPRPAQLDHLLTEDISDQIVAYLGKVRNFSRACALAGIPSGAGYRWLRQGRTDEAPQIFKDFTAKVTQQMVVIEQECVTAIVDASKDPMQWKAAAWMLERTLPRFWGEREKIPQPPKPEVAPTQMDGTQILTAVLAVLVRFPEARLEVANALKQLKAADAPPG